MKFSIRDLLLVTVAIALAVAWMVDRSQLAWRYDKVVGANERLRELLDNADPSWRTKPDNTPVTTRFDHYPNVTAAYITAGAIFGLVILLIVLAWQGRIHWDSVTRRLRG